MVFRYSHRGGSKFLEHRAFFRFSLCDSHMITLRLLYCDSAGIVSFRKEQRRQYTSYTIDSVFGFTHDKFSEYPSGVPALTA
jgi:hypothetical protein